MKVYDIIKYEGEKELLVWKHECEDFNTGTKLIVHESQEAIFVKNGQAYDIFGPGRYSLKTGNIPLLRKLLSLPTEGQTSFHCEVYFINKIVQMDIKWGTPDKIVALDPKFNILFHAGANGGMSIQILDSKLFLTSLTGLTKNVSFDDVSGYFKYMIITKVKSYLSTLMNELGFIFINQNLDDFSATMHEVLKEEMSKYGINLVNFFVSGIKLDNEDYAQIQTSLSRASSRNIEGFNWADEQIVDITHEFAKSIGNTAIDPAEVFRRVLCNDISLLNQTPAALSKNTCFEKQAFEHENTKKKFCSKCGRELPLDALFCSGCGNSVENVYQKCCAKCGRNLNNDDAFCPICGTKINQ